MDTLHIAVILVLTFCSLLTGVMGETLDTDLVGVVVAALCIAIISIVIIAFLAYWCFRQAESDRKSVIGRKDSGSVSTNAPTRWPPKMLRSNKPVYNVSTADPMMYSMPSSSNVFLGQHVGKGKVIDKERLQYSRHDHYKRRAHERDEDFYLPDTSRIMHKHAVSQPNGHVVHDLSTSNVSHKGVQVEQKQQKEDVKLPNWLKKTYVENEKTMEIQEEGSRKSSIAESTKQPAPSSPPPDPAPKPKPAELDVTTLMPPKHGNLKSWTAQNVSEEFTIIDFVDHGKRSRTSGQRSRPVEQGSRPSQRASSYLDRDYHTTTEITRYSAPKRLVADTSHGSAASSYVPPASTSTPRSPAETAEKKAKNVEHHRMRKPHEGSVRRLPSPRKKNRVPADFML